MTGNVRLSHDMVLQYGGIREGDNSLAVSIAKVERNLRKTPWVEEASVKRLLPDRFVIKLKERLPTFWVHKDGVLYYANERGEIIAPVESKNFLSLPTLRVESGAEDDLPYLTRLMKGMSPLLEDVSLEGAKAVLYNITAPTDITADEIAEIGEIIGDATPEDANIIFGVVFDDNIGDEIRLTVIATGIDSPQVIQPVQAPAATVTNFRKPGPDAVVAEPRRATSRLAQQNMRSTMGVFTSTSWPVRSTRPSLVRTRRALIKVASLST